MSYLPYKVTAIARSDNGDLNIIPGATVTVLNSTGGYATLREADFTTPIPNPFNCDENGERQIYLQGGSYTFSVDGGQSWEVRLSGASDIQSVETIADLISLPANEASRVVSVVEYCAGTGHGGGFFQYKPSVPKSLHNGGTVISPTVPYPSDDTDPALVDNYMRAAGETDPDGFGCYIRISSSPATIEDFGCVVGSYNTNHVRLSAALRYCETTGATLSALYARDYELSGWTTHETAGPIRFIGAGDRESCTRIVAPDTASTFIRANDSVVIKGVGGVDWSRFVDVDSFTGTIPILSITESNFNNVSTVVFGVNGIKSSSRKINSIYIAKNIARNSRSVVFGFTGAFDRAVIEENELYDGVYRGIQLGANADSPETVLDVEDLWQDMSVCKNRIVGLTRTGVGELQAIILYGWKATIDDNYIRDVVAPVGNTAAESIYTKCRFVDITKNKLIDAGSDQAAINIKGVGRGRNYENYNSPTAYSINVAHNHIVFTDGFANIEDAYGIHFETGDINIHHNHIYGAVEGITESPTTAQGEPVGGNVRIEDNDIVGTRGRRGISIRPGGSNYRLVRNTIDTILAAYGSGDIRGISIDFPGAFSSPNFRDYWVGENCVKGLPSANSYCLWVGGSAGQQKMYIDSNAFADADVGVLLNTGMRTATLTDNKFENIQTEEIDFTSFADVVMRDNHRYGGSNNWVELLTRDSGTAVIADGQSSVTVSPSSYQTAAKMMEKNLVVMPANATGAASNWRVSVGASTFDIIRDGTTGAASFRWKAGI